MLTGATILKFLSDRNNFDKFYPHLKLSLLSEEIKSLAEGFVDYYQNIEGDADLNEYIVWFMYMKDPEASPSKMEVYKDLIKQAQDAAP